MYSLGTTVDKHIPSDALSVVGGVNSQRRVPLGDFFKLKLDNMLGNLTVEGRRHARDDEQQETVLDIIYWTVGPSGHDAKLEDSATPTQSYITVF